MVRRLCLCVVLLAALLVVASGVQGQSTPRWHPNGELFQRTDGTYGYIVSVHDRVGQWQVAFGDPVLWLELVTANPQLRNPDAIMPGDELNVPLSLVKLFRIIAEVDSTKTSERDYAWNPPSVTGVGSTGLTTVPPVVASSGLPWWFWVLLALLVIALFLLLLQRSKLGRERREYQDAIGRRQIEERRAQLERGHMETQRRLADPYDGPPVVEGGLPTPETMLEHVGRSYQDERNRMTVGQSAQLPVRVSVTRIVPVWVWGEMGVRQGGHSTPVRKVLEHREPGWRAYLTDGSSRITLWRCGNDVYAGNGYDILPETQIKERTDLPSFTPTVPQQVWPEIAPSHVPAEIPTAFVPLQFATVRFDGPMRLVFQPGGQVLDLGPLVAQGVRISVGVQNGEVIVDSNGQRVVFGRIVGEQPAQSVPVALPAGTSEETARQVEEILAHVPADQGGNQSAPVETAAS